MRRSSFGVGQMRGVVLLVLVALAWADEYSFAVLSDMHIGESSQQTQLAQEAVAAINKKVASLDIRFVVITGDISNSAQPQQMEGEHNDLSLLLFIVSDNTEVEDRGEGDPRPTVRPLPSSAWQP